MSDRWPSSTVSFVAPMPAAPSHTPKIATRAELERPSRPGRRDRGREWEIITGLLRAAEKSRGGVLLIEGGSALGKSRLIGDAADAAATLGFSIAAGTADETSRLAPLAPPAAALAEPVHALRTASDPDTGGAIHTRLRLVEHLQGRIEERAVRGPLPIAADDLQRADPTTPSPCARWSPSWRPTRSCDCCPGRPVAAATPSRRTTRRPAPARGG